MSKLTGIDYINKKKLDQLVENLIDWHYAMQHDMEHGTEQQLKLSSKRFFEGVIRAYEKFGIETAYLAGAYRYFEKEIKND
jgi:uncharacterized protein YktA (UPF0223 family)